MSPVVFGFARSVNPITPEIKKENLQRFREIIVNKIDFIAKEFMPKDIRDVFFKISHNIFHNMRDQQEQSTPFLADKKQSFLALKVLIKQQNKLNKLPKELPSQERELNFYYTVLVKYFTISLKSEDALEAIKSLVSAPNIEPHRPDMTAQQHLDNFNKFARIFEHRLNDMRILSAIRSADITKISQEILNFYCSEFPNLSFTGDEEEFSKLKSYAKTYLLAPTKELIKDYWKRIVDILCFEKSGIEKLLKNNNKYDNELILDIAKILPKCKLFAHIEEYCEHFEAKYIANHADARACEIHRMILSWAHGKMSYLIEKWNIYNKDLDKEPNGAKQDAKKSKSSREVIFEDKIEFLLLHLNSSKELTRAELKEILAIAVEIEKSLLQNSNYLQSDKEEYRPPLTNIDDILIDITNILESPFHLLCIFSFIVQKFYHVLYIVQDFSLNYHEVQNILDLTLMQEREALLYKIKTADGKKYNLLCFLDFFDFLHDYCRYVLPEQKNSPDVQQQPCCAQSCRENSSVDSVDSVQAVDCKEDVKEENKEDLANHPQKFCVNSSSLSLNFDNSSRVLPQELKPRSSSF